MERSIGYKIAELEPIKGYNCTKTAILSQERLLRKFFFKSLRVYMPHRMAKKKEGLSKSQNTFYPGFYFIRS